MPTLFRDNVRELMQVGLNKVFFEALELVGNEWEQVFNVSTSDRRTETDVGYAGFTPLVEKPEGEPITYENIIEAYKKTYTMRTYAKGFRVTMETLQDDQYGVVFKAAREHGKMLQYTVNQTAFNVFNLAFSETAPGPDGAPLCSTAHPLKGGGTASNRPTTDVDFSVAAFQAALTRFQKQVNERGLNVLLKPAMVLYPPDLEFVVHTVLQKGGLPGTANNDQNVATALYNLKPVMSHFLTDTDAWFLLSDKDSHMLRFFWRLKPQTEMDGDFDTKDSKWSIVARWDVGFSDWRGVDGSTGA